LRKIKVMGPPALAGATPSLPAQEGFIGRLSVDRALRILTGLAKIGLAATGKIGSGDVGAVAP
jgi:hypothetical protein